MGKEKKFSRSPLNYGLIYSSWAQSELDLQEAPLERGTPSVTQRCEAETSSTAKRLCRPLSALLFPSHGHFKLSSKNLKDFAPVD